MNNNSKYIFGRTKDGRDVTAYRIENGRGASAVLLDYGCTVQSLCVPDARGAVADVVLGYDTVREYEENGGYAGAAVGRFANRIGRGMFEMNGRTYRLACNDGENHLHGGWRGFDKMLWKADDANENRLVFTRLSPDGEEGYPGSLAVTITYSLTDRNALRIVYDAVTDQDTVVNLTNHSYFNLNGGGSVLGHFLQVSADSFTENDPNCLPTGRLLPVSGTPFDFRTSKPLGRDIGAEDVQLRYGSGYDHNYVLQGDAPAQLKKAAMLHSPESGITMTAYTTQPGMQLYTGNHLTPRKGKNGVMIDRRSGVCLETQLWPNATAYPHFPSPILRAGERYHTETVYQFEL